MNISSERNRYSWNPSTSTTREIAHPSAFPSLLRGSTPAPDSRPSSSLSRRDSHNSTSHLNRKDSSGTISSTKRRDSSGTHSAVSRRDSNDHNKAKRDSLTEDFRRLSFGNSLYLRPDSSGQTNIVRRDSLGRRDSYETGRTRIPRDFVSNVLTNGQKATPIETSSILRTSNDSGDNKLTTANLSKHVTIWEKENNHDKDSDHYSGRRDSSGSLSKYLASKRMSIDSLDLRNSRRGSAASCEMHPNQLADDVVEVSSTNCVTNKMMHRLTLLPQCVCVLNRYHLTINKMGDCNSNWVN